MKKIVVLLISFLTLSVTAREFKDVISAQAAQVNRVNNEDFSVELPRFVFSHTNTRIQVKFKNPMHDKLVSNGYKLNFIVNGADQVVEFGQDGVGNITYTFKADNKLSILFEDASYTQDISVISVWYMILPLVGLLLFLGYKLAFTRRKLTVVSNREVTEHKAEVVVRASGMKLVKEEEEALAG